jgi:uncharacterized protein
MPELEQTCHREAAIVDRDTAARTITVQLCAWDEPRRVRDPWTAPYMETHARDSLVPAEQLAVYDRHLGELIGRMDPPTDGGTGPVTRLHIAHTRAGDDALALVDADVHRSVSMEFVPDAAGEVWNATRDAVTRTRSILTGCAFAFQPEHTAPILQRESEPTMPTIEETEQQPLEQQPGVIPLTPAVPHEAGGLDVVQAELVAMRGELARIAGARPSTGGARFDNLGALMRAAAGSDGAPGLPRDAMGGGVPLHRAWTDTTSADVPGLMPTQRLTELYDVIAVAQPLVEAAGTMPAPTALTITYPKITQRPLVAEQAGGEKTEIASREIKIIDATAPVRTYAGGTDVSLQVIQLSTPSYLEVAGQLYAEEMARATDAAAYVQYATSATHKVTIGVDPKLWNAKLFDLAALIASTSRRFPDRMVLSVDLWAKLGGAADADGRPLFPHAGATNPVGTASLTSPTGEVRNLAYSVDPNLPADRGAMFASSAFRSSLGPVQTLSVDVPRLLGRDMAVFRFGAFAAIDGNGLGLFSTGAVPADEPEADTEQTTKRGK